jgi:hypothetical protein
MLDRATGDAKDTPVAAKSGGRDKLIRAPDDRFLGHPGDEGRRHSAKRCPDEHGDRENIEPTEPASQVAIGGAERQRIVHDQLAVQPYDDLAAVFVKGPSLARGVPPRRNPIEEHERGAIGQIESLSLAVS